VRERTGKIRGLLEVRENEAWCSAGHPVCRRCVGRVGWCREEDRYSEGHVESLPQPEIIGVVVFRRRDALLAVRCRTTDAAKT
jgi:hypothetical protein